MKGISTQFLEKTARAIAAAEKLFEAGDTESAAGRALVESLIDESRFFIECTAAEAEVNIAAELVELQVPLACWRHAWPRWDVTEWGISSDT